jgi:hypothetical protein
MSLENKRERETERENEIVEFAARASIELRVTVIPGWEREAKKERGAVGYGRERKRREALEFAWAKTLVQQIAGAPRKGRIRPQRGERRER